MASISMQVTGLAELKEKLKQLPVNIGRNVLRGAVYAGARVVTDAVIEKAPVFTGNDPRVQAGLLKSAVYMVHSNSQSNDQNQVYFVSIRRGKKEQAKNRDAYYWTWVEFGHHIIPRVPKGGGSLYARRQAISSGATPVSGAQYVLPHPFFRPAFEASKDASAQAIRDYLAKRIPLEIEKLSRA